jgi:hypothetical protein
MSRAIALPDPAAGSPRRASHRLCLVIRTIFIVVTPATTSKPTVARGIANLLAAALAQSTFVKWRR